jgi:hypothetical protein
LNFPAWGGKLFQNKSVAPARLFDSAYKKNIALKSYRVAAQEPSSKVIIQHPA